MSSVQDDFDRLSGTAEEIRLALLRLKRCLKCCSDYESIEAWGMRRQARLQTLAAITHISDRAHQARCRIIGEIERLPMKYEQDADAWADRLQAGWPRLMQAIRVARDEVNQDSACLYPILLPCFDGGAVCVLERFPL